MGYREEAKIIMQDFSLIDFYRDQYLTLLRIGIGKRTLGRDYTVIITKSLINATKRRLNYLIVKSYDPNFPLMQIEKPRKQKAKDVFIEEEKRNLYSKEKNYFYTKDSSLRFSTNDLDILEKNKLDDCANRDYVSPKHLYHECQPQYIDRYTTAYRSDIMQEIMRQKGL